MSSGDGISSRFRAAGLVAAAAGAAVSLALMLKVGHRNNSTIPLLLLVLFTGWVLSPFIALVGADGLSRRWSPTARTALPGLMLVIAAGSVAIYGAFALSPPAPKPAAVFLLVPLGSWALMGLVLFVAARRSRGG